MSGVRDQVSARTILFPDSWSEACLAGHSPAGYGAAAVALKNRVGPPA